METNTATAPITLAAMIELALADGWEIEAETQTSIAFRKGALTDTHVRFSCQIDWQTDRIASARTRKVVKPANAVIHVMQPVAAPTPDVAVVALAVASTATIC